MNDRWSRIPIALHWLSAALLVGLLVVGTVMIDLSADDPLRRVLGKVHGIGGVSLGVLTLVRLVSRWLKKAPAPIPLGPLHRKGVAVIQALIYLALFGMAASGLATALGSNWHSYLDGGEPTAPVLDALRSRQVHGALWVGLLVLVAAHVAGVLVQQLRRGGRCAGCCPSFDEGQTR